jgi:hypothetical protein
MAITNGDLSCVPVAAVSTSDYVAGILDGPSRSVLFTNNQYAFTSGAVSGSNPIVPPNGEAALPTVTAVNPVIVDDSVNGYQVGMVKLTLSPNSSDVVNASSPQIFEVSPNALVVVSSAAS